MDEMYNSAYLKSEQMYNGWKDMWENSLKTVKGFGFKDTIILQARKLHEYGTMKLKGRKIVYPEFHNRLINTYIKRLRVSAGGLENKNNLEHEDNKRGKNKFEGQAVWYSRFRKSFD